ncbi:MAG: hypothetical protein [Wendovervirus sonii]|uniref:Uncharacterized protein n=1 Tax=phage Lak_Megaphage_Sonny TaxID=3109229 RepID=A0ABZ0Z5I8_9CAUD|nr:MAG: hypothetical protein [phage Lak_Megaphage_Sonny]
MKTIRINLNDIKKDLEARGYKLAHNTFENAVKQYIKDNKDMMLGEFDKDYSAGVDIKLTNVSHKLTNINIDDMTADIEILDTPQGKLLQEIMNSGFQCKPVVNATVEKNKRDKTKIYQIFSFDFTARPDEN